MRLLPLLLMAVLLAGLAFALIKATPYQPASPWIDKKLPPEMPLKIGGKFILLNFFASWCAPCHIEHPYLMELSKQKDLKMIGLVYKDKPEAIAAWLEKEGNPYQEIAPDNGKAAIILGVSGIPETFLIDPIGVVRYHFQGPIQKEERDKILSLIKE
ncbi:MAG: redoxin family protein [Dongiaceae bacterium]